MAIKDIKQKATAIKNKIKQKVTTLRKRVKCLTCRLLVSLGLKSVSSCKAGPLPTVTSAPKSAATKTKKTTKKKSS